MVRRRGRPRGRSAPGPRRALHGHRRASRRVPRDSAAGRQRSRGRRGPGPRGPRRPHPARGLRLSGGQSGSASAVVDLAGAHGRAASGRSATSPTSGARPPPSGRSRWRRPAPTTCCYRPARCRQDHARPPASHHSAGHDPREALETTKIHSVAGVLERGPVPLRPAALPGASPHHQRRRPHRRRLRPAARAKSAWRTAGVLFLDELPEFRRNVLEVLRQPLEDGLVTLSRAAMSLSFPARFMLAAAMNPCPCGYFGDRAHACRCSAVDVERYRSRVSGPLLDRIDIHLEVPAVPYRRPGRRPCRGNQRGRSQPGGAGAGRPAGAVSGAAGGARQCPHDHPRPSPPLRARAGRSSPCSGRRCTGWGSPRAPITGSSRSRARSRIWTGPIPGHRPTSARRFSIAVWIGRRSPPDAGACRGAWRKIRMRVHRRSTTGQGGPRGVSRPAGAAAGPAWSRSGAACSPAGPPWRARGWAWSACAASARSRARGHDVAQALGHLLAVPQLAARGAGDEAKPPAPSRRLASLPSRRAAAPR